MRRAVSWLNLAAAMVALLAGTGELSRLHPSQLASNSLLTSQEHQGSNSAISKRNLQQVSTVTATASASAQAPASEPSGLTLVVFQQVSLTAFCSGFKVWLPGLGSAWVLAPLSYRGHALQACLACCAWAGSVWVLAV